MAFDRRGKILPEPLLNFVYGNFELRDYSSRLTNIKYVVQCNIYDIHFEILNF